jgi:hypothetical protein
MRPSRDYSWAAGQLTDLSQIGNPAHSVNLGEFQGFRLNTPLRREPQFHFGNRVENHNREPFPVPLFLAMSYARHASLARNLITE